MRPAARFGAELIAALMPEQYYRGEAGEVRDILSELSWVYTYFEEDEDGEEGEAEQPRKYAQETPFSTTGRKR